MEHTVNSLRVTSGNYPRINSNVSEFCFQSRVLKSTPVDRKQRYTIECHQSQAGEQGSLSYPWSCRDRFVLKSHIVGPRQRRGHATITINWVRHQTSTKTFQSCDIDKIMIGHEDCVFQVMIFAGILHHLKILCKGLGISHLTYGKDDTNTGIGGLLPLLGFKCCTCTDMASPSKCIAIPSTQRVGQEVPLNDRAQGARRVGAKGMHSASDECDLSTITSRLDRGGKVQKSQRRCGEKVYCTHWLSKGNCAYMQQGCIYKHEIPKDQETWEILGFHTIPGWLQAKSSAWINQHLRKSPDLSEDLSAEGPGIARRSQPHINTSQNLREDGDRPPALERLQPRPDVSRTALSTQFPSLFEGSSSSDRFARPCNKRAHPPSADITRKWARNDCDDWGHTTKHPKRPRCQKDLFPDHAKKGDIESMRLHSTDSIDDPGYHVRCASRGRWGNSREPSHQPPSDWLTASAGSTSGASCGNDYGEDPVLQASQFLGEWQIETPDVVWGSYPSYESYPPNRPQYLRDPYRPSKP